MPYSSTTLADLKVVMVQRWDQVVFWTDEEARLALNEALREWNLLTGRWRTRALLNVSAGNHEIDLPASMTYGMRITTAAGQPLQPTSLLELDLALPQWRGQTASPPLIWAPISLTRVAVWPTYAVDTPNGLVADGVLRTPVLVNDADTVNLGDEIIDVIADMALHVAAFKEAGPRWRATRPYFDTFLQAAADENGLLKQNQAYRRWAGLDRRRDLQPTKDAPNQMQGVATQFSRHTADAQTETE